MRQRTESIGEAQGLEGGDRVLPAFGRNEQVGVAVGPNLARIEPGCEHRPLQHDALDSPVGKFGDDPGSEAIDREVAQGQRLDQQLGRRRLAHLPSPATRSKACS